MSVIYRYGNFSRYIARPVGGNDCLFTIRGQSELIVRVECNISTVYGYACNIFFRDCNRLRFAVCLAVFNARNHGGCSVKHYSLGAQIFHIAACIGQLCINHILVIGVDTERSIVFGKACACKLLFAQCPVTQQITDCDRFAAVVACRDCYRLRILEEQPEGDFIQDAAPFVFADTDFACGSGNILPLCRKCDTRDRFGGSKTSVGGVCIYGNI